ncbi:MAG TPA: metal ABC transporter permease [Candidatus Dependentiae bacterium]|nr:metal ABC transporter permease [Candidatus Dependentiae bacterium]HRQ62825.1 metal ABC transporter permease [Candidatus Dependentiae bacterium]
MLFQLNILIIACLVAIACVLPGIFLVLRGVALMSDAISHAILPGIAIMFLVVQRLESPLLIVGASCAGLLTVICTERLIQTRRLKKDAAIGLVFPFFFSVGVIIISLFARNVHLDTDIVLLGELAFAPFNRLMLFGVYVGPYALWILAGIASINALFVLLFYKELQLLSFDESMCNLFQFKPALLYYALMTITSITAVAAFDIVGSIVVVALMITPPATAYLCTHRLQPMILLSIFFGIVSALFGYAGARVFDVSIAGSIASMGGILFLGALLCAPYHGLVARIIRLRYYKHILARKLLCTYLAQSPQTGNHIDDIAVQLGWQPMFTQAIAQEACNNLLVTVNQGWVQLTLLGHQALADQMPR